MMRHRNRWVLALLLLVMVVATSCTRRCDDDKDLCDPEGRLCIPVRRAMEIPPQYCPLKQLVDLEPGEVLPPNTLDALGRELPAGKKEKPVIEFMECKDIIPRTSTDGEQVDSMKLYAGYRCNMIGTGSPTSGNATVEVTMLPCGPAPYFVPILNEANPTLGPVAWIKSEIQTIMAPAVQGMFTGISEDSAFRSIVIALVTMSIAFYSFTTMLSLRPPNLYELIVLSLKIMFVLAFAFNWSLFRDIVYNSLEDTGSYISPTEGTISLLSKAATEAGQEAAKGVTLGEISGESDGGGSLGADGGFVAGNLNQRSGQVYMQLDAIIATLLSWNFQKLLLALIISGATGILYAIILIMMVFNYLFAVFAVTQALMIALLGRMFLYALAPLFIMCALLDLTKQFFRNWLEMLLNFSLQPILLSAFLGMFLSLITTLISQIIPVGGEIQMICYKSWFSIMSFFDLLYFWQFSDIQGNPVKGGPYGVLPINIYVIGTVFLLSSLMKGMSQWITNLSAVMTGGVVATTGTFIAGSQTLGEYAKILPAGAAGGFRGALFGSRFTGAGSGMSGGLTRGRNPIKGMFDGARKSAKAQHDSAKGVLRKEMGKFGADQ